MTRLNITLAALILGTSACLPIDDAMELIIPTEPGDPSSPSDPADPVVPGDPTPAATAGRYHVQTTFDLTLDVVLPGQAYEVVTVLRDFRADPAATLFALLDDAGVPLVADLLDALPSSLEDKLMGWINGYLEEALYDDTPVMDIIDEVLAVAEMSLTRFDMMSEWQLSAADADGRMTLDHRLTGLRFPAIGLADTVDIPDLGPLTNDQTTAWLDRDASGAAGSLVLDEHGFGLPYGEYAYMAVESLMQQRYGMSVRESLGAAISCPTLAANVADRCVLGVCVGHEQELQAICDQGLDLAVDKLHEKFAEYRFDALVMDAGEAEILDDLSSVDYDGQMDLVRGGAWQSRIDASQGLRPIGAEFAGVRAP